MSRARAVVKEGDGVPEPLAKDDTGRLSATANAGGSKGANDREKGGGGGGGGEGAEEWLLRAERYLPDKVDVIRRVRELIAKGGELNRARTIMRLLHGAGLTAEQAFEGIHKGRRGERPPFSHFVDDTPTGFATQGYPSFAHYYLAKAKGTDPETGDEIRMGEGDTILEIGSGCLRDAQVFANAGVRVIAVDASPGVVMQGQRFLERKGLQSRIVLERGDIREILKKGRRHPLFCNKKITGVYSFSAFHYWLPDIIEVMLRQIHELLEDERGSLGLALKTSGSAAAQSDRQVGLGNGPFYPRIDGQRKVFRIYPSSEGLDGLLRSAGFQDQHVTHKFDADLLGYEAPEQVEKMRYIIARVVALSGE